jgi:outer membrane lipoprotein-sorting protein
MSYCRNILAISLALLLTAPVINAQGDLTDPYLILNKHYDAIGGLDKVRAEKSSYTEGTIVIEGTGLQGTVKNWTRFPNKSRQEVDLIIIKQVAGDNGEFVWVVDANGKLQIKQDEATTKRRKISELLKKFGRLDPNSENFVVTYEGIEKVDTIDCYVIKTANNINDDYSLEYINVATFFVEKSADIRPDEETRVLYSDYRKVGGIMRAFHQDIETFPIVQKVAVQMEKYESNTEIDPSLFEPPGQDVRDYEFTEGESAEDVPFRFIGRHLYIMVNIDGKERMWCLDTGAGMSVIDKEFASELGLAVEGNIKGAGASNVVDVSFTDLPPFSIPGIQFQGQKAAAIDVRPLFRESLGLEVDGILGYDFLSRFVVMIDYANEKLSFYDPDKVEYDGTGAVLDAPLRGNTFALPMTVDGEHSGDWSLDIGAGGMNFHYPYSEEHGFLELDGIDRIGRGAGGEFKERTVQFDSVQFAGFTLHDCLIDITLEKGEGAFRSSELVGNLGNTLFRHFVLYLDYKRQQVIVEKGDDFDHEFPRDKSGLQVYSPKEDRIEILFVSPGTPADKAGFEKGDVVKSINGIGMQYLDGLLAIRELLEAAPGTKYRFLVLRGGSEKELDLKLKELY